MRGFLIVSLGVHFLGVYTLPDQALHAIVSITILNLLTNSYEAAKKATVEVKEIKCKACDVPMYSRTIKCPDCSAYRNLEDKK